MGHGLPLLLVHPLQQRFRVDDGTRGAVAVIGVTFRAGTGRPCRAAREGALEEVVGDLLAGAVLASSGGGGGASSCGPLASRAARKLSSKRLLIVVRV